MSFFVPQSLLDEKGMTLQQAQTQYGNTMPGGGATPGTDAWNQSQGWNDVINAAVAGANGNAGQYSPGGWESTVATAVGGGAPAQQPGGLGGLGGFDMNGFMSQWQQQQQQALQQQNQSMQDMMASWQKGFGAQQGSTYDPTGVGGTFSNSGSPVYRPGGESDSGKPVNGFGGAWGGNGPFRPSF
ncbi:hypothetical protein [Aurantimonas coralicida]|uniref:hypothetical protein n=1 Tax=Aurantimonas coralicida TaxID=182270 RepID=UPI001E2EE608|nr:hypothetical protein [Aurantimonas coralicida]MCD1644163.1 hypothetical protein [Aurantimonas coralicida]